MTMNVLRQEGIGIHNKNGYIIQFSYWLLSNITKSNNNYMKLYEMWSALCIKWNDL